MPVDRRFKATDYIEILEDVLITTMERVYGEEVVINVVEDRSSIHTAGIVNNWFEEHPQLRRIQLPPRTPELNIIENVWAEMVREWNPSMAANEQQLMVRVTEAWDSMRINQGFLQKLTDSMPRLLRKLIEVGGANIHY